jgi:hypothetical protein
MSVHRLLHERQAVRLEFPDCSGVSVEATVSRLAEHLLWLECAAGEAVPALSVGARVLVRCWDPFGAYCASTRVAEIAASPPVQFAVEAAGPLETTENRRFYRVRVQIPFVFSTLKGASSRVPSSGQTADAVTQDVSPGGLRFCTSQPLMIGDRLALRLTYLAERLEVEGRVVRALVSRGSGERAISVEFLNAGDSVQIKLVRLIFAEQQRAQVRG